MQSVNPNSLFGMLTDQNPPPSSDSIWGLKPQMGRFLSSDKASLEGQSTFANIFLQLQAGAPNDQANSLDAYRLASSLDGNKLPAEGQDLPLLDHLSHDLITNTITNESVKSTQFELSAQTGEERDGLDELISVEQIDEAQNIASHLDSEHRANIENRLNKNLELARDVTTPLETSQVSGETVVSSQIRLDAESLEKQDKSNPSEAVENEAAPELVAAYAHPLSGLDANLIKNKAPLKTTAQDYSLKGTKGGINSSSLPLNLRPQAGTQLSEALLADENVVDEQTLSGIKSATLSVSDLKSESMGAVNNLNQLPSQSMQSLNVQAGQIQSFTSLQMDANAAAELEQSIEQAEGEVELNMNEQLNKLSNKQDSLYLGKQSQLWGKQLGEHITTLIKQDVQEAKIHLDPPELGSLEIKLQVQHQEAKVQIQVSQPQVREVLEQQSARLREALAQEGMSLSGFDVSSGNQNQTGQQAQEQGSLFAQDELSGLEGESESSNTQMKAASVSVSLVDTFA